jgi:hypothetical protein
VQDKVCKISQWGLPPVYANPDGSVYTGSGTYMASKYSTLSLELISIAVLAMYEGHKEFGLDLLRKNQELDCCHWGYMWDGVCLRSAYGDTGEWSFGWDYWFNWCIWMAAAALAKGDFTALLKPGGLVNRMIKAGSTQ